MIRIKDHEDDPLRAADGIVRGMLLGFLLWAVLLLAWAVS